MKKRWKNEKMKSALANMEDDWNAYLSQSLLFKSSRNHSGGEREEKDQKYQIYTLKIGL